MSDQVASHSNETQAYAQNQAVEDAFKAFGLDVPGEQENAAEDNSEAVETDVTDAPATEQEPTSNVIKVKAKVDKEEREFELTEDQLPEYVQKAYALDRERQRKAELQEALDRAAKLAGFKDHAEYLANLDKLEQEAQKRRQDEFEQVRQRLREQAEAAGLDPESVEEWVSKHPDFIEAQRIKQEAQERAQRESQERMQQEWTAKWEALYTAYPELRESAIAFAEGGTPDWYTPEMQARIERGYDPLDAYELAHKDAIIERNKQMAKQQALKEQRLGLRAQVETDAGGELEPEVPQELATAFSLFGLDPKAARKYVKK